MRMKVLRCAYVVLDNNKYGNTDVVLEEQDNREGKNRMMLPSHISSPYVYNGVARLSAVKNFT